MANPPDPKSLDETFEFNVSKSTEAATPSQQNSSVEFDNAFPQLCDYQILRKLGEGGMGIVYEAKHLSLDRRVALKVLPGGKADDDMSVKRFIREARSAASLHHTNIVPVFDVGCNDDIHYYAMQLIEGSPLDDVINEARKLRRSGVPNAQSSDVARDDTVSSDLAASLFGTTTVSVDLPKYESSRNEQQHCAIAAAADSDGEQSKSASSAGSDMVSPSGTSQQLNAIIGLGVQVAEALQHAHSAGILHRDIKPANLMLDQNQNVWVTDFGLAKTQDEGLTRTGGVVGTLRYMAPERFRGMSDGRGDVYALGVTLFELLSLTPAFEADDQVSLIDKILKVNLPRLRTIDPQIPKDIETIVQKTVEKDPGRRYETAGELAADMRRFLSGEPILARRSTVFERVAMWARKNKQVAALLSVLMCGLVGIAVASLIASSMYQRLAEETKIEADRAVAINRFFNEDILGAGNPNEGNIDQNTTLLSVLDAAAAKLDNQFSDHPEVEGQIRLTIGGAYLALGKFQSAEQHLQQALTIFQRTRDSNHDDVLEAKLQLGRMHLAARKSASKAFQLIRSVQQQRVAALGFDHPGSLAASQALATMQFEVGQEQQGLELMTKVHEGSRRTFGDSNRRTIEALSLVGELTLPSDAQAAEPMIRQAYLSAKSVLGEEDMVTLTARTNLAQCYINLKSPDRALKIAEENRQAAERWLGAYHPQTIETLKLLANVHNQQGDATQSVDVAREIVDRTITTYGANTLKAVEMRLGLAEMLHDAGRYAEAAEVANGVRMFYVSESGEGSPDIAGVDKLLGRIESAQGNFVAANARLLRAYDVLRASYGPDDARTRSAMIGLISHYAGTEQIELAKPLMRLALTQSKKIYGEHSLNTAVRMQELAFALNSLGELDEAEDLLRRSLEVFETSEQIGIFQQEQTHQGRLRLAACLIKQQQFAEAAQLSQQVVQYDAWSPVNQWQHFSAEGYLAEARIGLGQLDDLEALLVSADEGLERTMTGSSVALQRRYRMSMAKRFILFYEAVEQEEQKAKWEAILAEYERDNLPD